MNVLKKNEVVTLEITDMRSEGMGVGKFGEEKFVIFVKNTAIGDVIECQIVKVDKRYAYGIIHKMLKPSESRIENDCSAYPQCGGCNFRHVDYKAELQYKQLFVRQAFKNIFKNDENLQINEIICSEKIEYYRNKAQYPVFNGQIGFYALNSHRLIPIKTCPLQDKSFEPILNIISEYIKKFNVSSYNEMTKKGLIRHVYLRKAQRTGEIMVCLVINGNSLVHSENLVEQLIKIDEIKSIYININKNDTNVIIGETCNLIWGKETITDEMCGIKLEISPLSFYQVNTNQAEKIYNYVAEIAELSPNDIVLELYSGIGAISLSLARYVKHSIGVEIIPDAVANAEKNAQINNITNVSFYVSDAAKTKDIIKQLPKDRQPNVVIIDPPRKGIGQDAIDAIKQINPEKLIYISCNPKTQAEDIEKLEDYKITAVQPFDMFPRTVHVESVCLLSKLKN